MKSTIKCILLDDDLHSLEYLKLLCSQIEGVEVVKCFSDPLQLLQMKDELAYDTCLLDIDMPSLNGLEVAQFLGNKYVIFTTAHSQYAAEAFDMEAVDFIRKPIQKNRLEKAFLKVGEKISINKSPQTFHVFNTDKGKTLMNFEDILYITTEENEKRDKLLYLEGGQIHRLKNITLEKLLSILPHKTFYQVNKSDIIAIKAVHLVHYDEITLKLTLPDDKPLCITLGYKYRDQLIKALNH